MTKIINLDWVPRYVNSGAVTIINDLSFDNLEISEFVKKFNNRIDESLPSLDQNMLLQLVSDLKSNGLTPLIGLDDGQLGISDIRDAAPTGFGNDGTGVWFSEPSSGTKTTAIYVNGIFKLSQVKDLSSDRGFNLSAIGAIPGDKVQICFITNDVVGFWGEREIV